MESKGPEVEGNRCVTQSHGFSFVNMCQNLTTALLWITVLVFLNELGKCPCITTGIKWRRYKSVTNNSCFVLYYIINFIFSFCDTIFLFLFGSLYVWHRFFLWKRNKDVRCIFAHALLREKQIVIILCHRKYLFGHVAIETLCLSHK